MGQQSNQYRSEILTYVSNEIYWQLQHEKILERFQNELNRLHGLIEQSLDNDTDEIEQEIEYCKDKLIQIAGNSSVREFLDNYHQLLLTDRTTNTFNNAQDDGGAAGFAIIIIVLIALGISTCYPQIAKTKITDLRDFQRFLVTPISPDLQQPRIFMPTEIPLKSK